MRHFSRKAKVIGLGLLVLILISCGGGGAAATQIASATEPAQTLQPIVTASPEPADTATPEPSFTQISPVTEVPAYAPTSEIPQLMAFSQKRFWVKKGTDLTELGINKANGDLIAKDSVITAGNKSHFYTGEILNSEGKYCLLAFDPQSNKPMVDKGYCFTPFDPLNSMSQTEITKQCEVPDGFVSVGTTFEFTDSAGLKNTMAVYEDGLAVVKFDAYDEEPLAIFPCKDFTLVDYNHKEVEIFYGRMEIFVPEGMLATPTPPAVIPSAPVYSS